MRARADPRRAGAFSGLAGPPSMTRNLDRLGRDRVRFMALPLRLEGGAGAPARAIAILD